MPRKNGICQEVGCTNRAVSRQLCTKHYSRARRAGTLPPKLHRTDCDVEGCDRKHFGLGLCQLHYRQSRALRTSAPKCSVPECGSIAYTVGLCQNHYSRTWKFNITADQLSDFLSRPCAICGSRDNPHIDHDHSCCPGARSCGNCIRGVLCSKCNHGVGLFQDDPDTLEAAANYLRERSGNMK